MASLRYEVVPGKETRVVKMGEFSFRIISLNETHKNGEKVSLKCLEIEFGAVLKTTYWEGVKKLVTALNKKHKY